MGIRPVLFEDHTLMHFRPLAWSVPVPEIRCGLFNARERVDLVQPGGGLLAVRPELASLVRAPGWQALPAAPASGQTLWLSGRLAPDCRQVSALLAAAAAGEFALTDTSGLLAMAAGAGGSDVAESWTRWAAGNLAAPQAGTALPAWSPPLPATWDRTDVGSGLVWHRPQEGGAPPPAELAPALAWIWNIVPRTPAELAGLRADDLILFIDDRLMESRAAVRNELQFIHRDDQLEITIQRDNAVLTLTVDPHAQR